MLYYEKKKNKQTNCNQKKVDQTEFISFYKQDNLLIYGSLNYNCKIIFHAYICIKYTVIIVLYQQVNRWFLL